MIEKPQILTLNLDSESNNALKNQNLNIYEGSLGKLVNTNNTKYQHKYCLLNNDFPANIHEFDIVIVDLNNIEKENYIKGEHIRSKNKTSNNTYLLSKYPQTIFDPRGYSSYLLVNGIKEIMKHDSLLIVIQAENEEIDYTLVEENGDYPKIVGEEKFSIYEFMPMFPYSKNKEGLETNVKINHELLNSFLSKYNDEFHYEITFYHPEKWNGEKHEKDSNFYPLVTNRDDEIISFANFHDNTGLFLFPIMKRKADFLLEFLENIAPDILPKIFPYSSKNLWVNDNHYYLPNHEKLLTEKKQIREEYEKKTKQKEEEIEKNTSKYKFLHELITETGDELVKATICFLEWLGFENVKDVDETAANLKEEDIQIENNNGLLVIEVKGIGGTSKDSECNQIAKIKYRRAKERGAFDVFGLYIVNHQRHLPPIDRRNPPFTNEQVADAENEERGLLTTYQLFQLYFLITNGYLTKEEARACFYNYGLIDFVSQNYSLVDTVEEVFRDGLVSILNVTDTKLETGAELLVQKNGSYFTAKIQEIKVNDKIVTEIDNGEIGIMTDIRISKKSRIWIKNLP